MFKKLLFVALVGSLTACSDGGDSGKTDDNNNADGTCASGGGACWFGDTVCIDYSSGAEAWCGGVGGEYEASACAGSEDASCDIPAGANADYPECATAYYYDNSDPAAACAGVGGTFNE